MKQEIRRFNDQVANVVTMTTGNMFFFWASLLFILVLRIAVPPTADTFLLNLENDLQLLLLAANAVVGGKQLLMLTKMLNHIDRDIDKVKKEPKIIVIARKKRKKRE